MIFVGVQAKENISYREVGLTKAEYHALLDLLKKKWPNFSLKE